MQSFPPTFQMWLSKFASGHSAVATTMFRWKRWESSICPLCCSAEETTEHVLLCTHHTSSHLWQQQITQLQDWLTHSGTDPVIQGCLLSTLAQWNHSTFYSHALPLCHLATRDQDHIGFFGLMVGRIATQWIGIQDTYYRSVGSPHSATLWMSRLCRQLILISHAMWTSRNQQVIQVRRQQAIAATLDDIRTQFTLGTQHLLPVDQFYVTPGTNGFTLQQVLDLPPDDQLLWLHAIRNAQARGRELPQIPPTGP